MNKKTSILKYSYDRGENNVRSSLPIMLFSIFWAVATLAAAMTLTVGHFSAGDMGGWKTKSFLGMTDYQLVTQDGRQVLEAHSKGTASGLVREIRIDLEKLPFLNWSWRVDDVLTNIDERTQAGDDYPAGSMSSSPAALPSGAREP